jgi:hypothetical protein
MLFFVFCRPYRASKIFGRLTQGVALGYYLSGLQPFEFAKVSVIRVKVFFRIKSVRVFRVVRGLKFIRRIFIHAHVGFRKRLSSAAIKI